MNYIKAHPFSAVNLGAGSEVTSPPHENHLHTHIILPPLKFTLFSQVRYIAPVFPWNDPKFARPPVSSLEVPKASCARVARSTQLAHIITSPWDLLYAILARTVHVLFHIFVGRRS
jgi:hypothetical protein